MQPLSQILDHIKKKNLLIQREQDKKLQSKPLEIEERDQSKVTHKQLTVFLSHFFLTVIQEIGDANLIDIYQEQSNEAYLSSNFTPIVTIESKHLKLRSIKQSDGSIDKLKV